MPIRTVSLYARIAGLSALAQIMTLGLSTSAQAQTPAPGNPEIGLRESMEPADPTLPRETPARGSVEPSDDTPQAQGRTAPNFGKRRPLADPRLAYPGRPKLAKKPLPPTVPYATAPRVLRATSASPLAPPPPTPYAEPAQIPRPARPKIDENPYAPIGVGFGSLRLFPFVETSVGFDSNANRSPTIPKGSTFNRIDAGVRAQSNWSVHEFKADVTGGYSKFYNVEGADRPEGAAKFNLRLDATRDTKVDLELRGTLSTQRPGSPELNATVLGRPAIFTYGATGGITRNFGRLETTIAALVDRTSYEDGRLSSGNIVPLAINDYTSYGVRGRVGYEFTPGIKPFVEVTADTRQRDTPVDLAGYQRNSNGMTARVGTTFELTRTLTGEVSAGYINRKYSDSRLQELRGATFDASLIWTASPLTTVAFRAATSANETTLVDSPGYISRRASVEISHALLRNLTIGGIAQWQNDKYQGINLSQDTFAGTMKIEYALTRSVVLKGSFTHERLNSSVPGADYTANVYLLGLRLQR